MIHVDIERDFAPGRRLDLVGIKDVTIGTSSDTAAALKRHWLACFISQGAEVSALSRGAGFACFVEIDTAAATAIGANAAALGATGRVQVLRGSALALPRAEPFDLVFADPPYAPGSGSSVASSVAAAGWLAPGGWLAIETARGERVEPAGFTVDVDRVVGRARLSLLRAPSSPTA